MSAFTARWLLLGMLGVSLLSNTSLAAGKINPHTLCPISGSKGQTILLIDTTDPLPEVAQERLKQLLKSMGDHTNEHYIQPKHELIVYHVTPQIAYLQKPIRVCNPGHPKDINPIIDSSVQAKLMWRYFEIQRFRALPKREEQVSGEQSPLLESIAVITARHIPNLGEGGQHKPARLILFSDMLQHSDLLSHYKRIPTMDEFKTLVGYAEMSSDLNDVDVWLFYVRRTNLERIQTPKHYYWWTYAIDSFGGHLIEQTPL